MSYSAETTYYGLPLPTGSDKSTFTDNNTAFQAVDAALHTAAEGAAQAAEDITSLTSRVGTAEDDIDALELDLGTEKGKISALQEKETLQDSAINDVRSDCEGMVSAYNEPTATSTHAYVAGDYFIYNDVLFQATDTIAIGDTIVPNTNCSTTTVAEELAEVNTDLASKQDASDNSLTTTDKTIVGAINELDAAIADYTVKHSVTSDGIKTTAQLLAELYSYITPKCKLRFIINASNVHRDCEITQVSATQCKFTGFNATLTELTIQEYDVAADSADCHRYIVTIPPAGTVTLLDGASDVLTDGAFSFAIVN